MDFFILKKEKETESTELQIDRYLESIHKKCPDETRKEIEKRTRLIFDGKGELPLIYSVADPLSRLRNFPSFSGKDKKLDDLLLYLCLMDNSLDYESDYYPALNSGLRQVTIPSLFGCKEIFTEKTSSVEPVIRTSSDVDNLKVRYEGSVAQEILDSMQYNHERTGLPLYITDMQGPFSAACHLATFEVFINMIYDEPEQAKKVLEIVTDAIIDYFYKMKEVTKDNLICLHCHPHFYLPREKGVAVSDDYFAIISKDLSEEFSIPYINKIAEEFGGITVHSCGSIEHQFELLNQIPLLKAVNFSSTETNLEEAIKKLRREIFIITHNSPVQIGNLKLLNQVEHLKHCSYLAKKYGRKLGVICLGFDEDNLPIKDKMLYKQIARDIS